MLILFYRPFFSCVRLVMVVYLGCDQIHPNTSHSFIHKCNRMHTIALVVRYGVNLLEWTTN